jgi:hypothetical protein
MCSAFFGNLKFISGRLPLAPFFKTSKFHCCLCASVHKCTLSCLPSFWAPAHSAQIPSGKNWVKSCENKKYWEYWRNWIVITFSWVTWPWPGPLQCLERHFQVTACSALGFTRSTLGYSKVWISTPSSLQCIANNFSLIFSCLICLINENWGTEIWSAWQKLRIIIPSMYKHIIFPNCSSSYFFHILLLFSQFSPWLESALSIHSSQVAGKERQGWHVLG